MRVLLLSRTTLLVTLTLAFPRRPVPVIRPKHRGLFPTGGTTLGMDWEFDFDPVSERVLKVDWVFGVHCLVGAGSISGDLSKELNILRFEFEFHSTVGEMRVE
ncbi:hypothetical protein Droror1_Dr00018419, partial [Drosera rotundifolia]